jgi:hypothetical protein
LKLWFKGILAKYTCQQKNDNIPKTEFAPIFKDKKKLDTVSYQAYGFLMAVYAITDTICVPTHLIIIYYMFYPLILLLMVQLLKLK